MRHLAICAMAVELTVAGRAACGPITPASERLFEAVRGFASHSLRPNRQLERVEQSKHGADAPRPVTCLDLIEDIRDDCRMPIGPQQTGTDADNLLT